jgi:hypothetical protein
MKWIRVAGSLAVTTYELLLYFASLATPVLWLYQHRTLPILGLLAAAIAGYICAGLTFPLLLVATKRLLIGRLSTGHMPIYSTEANRWFLAASLICILDRSPFRGFVTENPILVPWFFRGIGGRVPASTAFGTRAMIFDPYFLELGNNVSIGTRAVILGHVAQNDEIILDNVVIGDNVLIGGQSIIFPGVRIGNNAKVGMGAIVTRGTIIPDGEVWAGVPAKRIA